MNYPREWNHGIIIPIQKTKEEYPQPEETGTKTLLNVISKVLERSY